MAITPGAASDVNGQMPATPPMTPPTQPTVSPIPQAPAVSTQMAAPNTAAPGALPQATPTATMPTTPTVAPVASSAPGVGAPGAQTFGADSNLLGTQINPTANAATTGASNDLATAANKLTTGPNRFDLAQQAFNTSASASQPAYDAAIRDATQKAAANGAIGSGQLGTDYGNLALARTRDLENQQSSLLNTALGGTIGDQQTNTGLLAGIQGQDYSENANDQNALRSERGYQAGQEQTGYDRGVQGLTLQDALTNSAFGRSLAQEQTGMQGNPSGTDLALAGDYGQQATQAGNALGGLVNSSSQNNILNAILAGQQKPTPLPAAAPSPIQGALYPGGAVPS